MHKLSYLVMFVVLVACGGGGGNGTNDSAASLTPPAGGSELRTIQVGDSLSFRITGTIAESGGVLNISDSTLTRTITGIQVNPSGIECLVINISGVLSASGTNSSGAPITVSRSLDSIYLQAQDSTGLFECGDWDETLDQPRFLTNENGVVRSVKSPIQVGDVTTYITTYPNGEWEDCTDTVLAFENIQVPAGIFETYKIHSTCQDSNGVVDEADLWVSSSPLIVRMEIKGDLSTLAVFELESYSLK